MKRLINLLLFVILSIVAFVAAPTPTSAQSSTEFPSKWATACNFSDSAILSSLPPIQLITDNYAARSESRAMLQVAPQYWRVSSQLTTAYLTATALMSSSTTSTPVCASRFQFNGFVSPFWLQSILPSSSSSDETITAPVLGLQNSEDVSWFASCSASLEQLNVNPITVTVTEVNVSGGSWNTTATATSATVAADSRCDLTATQDLKQFVKIFAVVNGAAEEILPTSSALPHRKTQWVATNLRDSCPIYFGAVLDGSICPGVVAFSGTPTVSFNIQVTASTDAALVWYMWTPSLIAIGLGLLCLIIFIKMSGSARLPTRASPDKADPSMALAFAKIFLVSACPISAIPLAIVFVIDQNRDFLSGTSSAVILMGALFCISIVLVIAVAGVLAGKEDKRLKAMAVFIVAWLRLVSRSLALGTTCAAWYRGYVVTGVLCIVCQFFTEIGFWANLATTFSGSHEPLRFGVPGDQMLVLSEVGIAGMFIPFVGVMASAASRVFCCLEMSERFQIDKAAQAAAGLDGDEEPKTRLNLNQHAAAAAQAVAVGEEEAAGTAAGGDDKNKGKNTQQQQSGDHDDRLPFAVFPVRSTAALAAVFEGILSSRWWGILFEVVGLAALSLALARAHPPYVPYAIMHVFAALGHLGAGFGGIAGGQGFGDVNGGFKAVLTGDIRPVCEVAAKTSLAHPTEDDDEEDAGDGEGADLLGDQEMRPQEPINPNNHNLLTVTPQQQQQQPRALLPSKSTVFPASSSVVALNSAKPSAAAAAATATSTAATKPAYSFLQQQQPRSTTTSTAGGSKPASATIGGGDQPTLNAKNLREQALFLYDEGPEQQLGRQQQQQQAGAAASGATFSASSPATSSGQANNSTFNRGAGGGIGSGTRSSVYNANNNNNNFTAAPSLALSGSMDNIEDRRRALAEMSRMRAVDEYS